MPTGVCNLGGIDCEDFRDDDDELATRGFRWASAYGLIYDLGDPVSEGAILYKLNSAQVLPNDFFTANKPTFIEIRNPRTEYDTSMSMRLLETQVEDIQRVEFIQ